MLSMLVAAALAAPAPEPPRFAVQNGVISLTQTEDITEPKTPGITPRPADAVVYEATCQKHDFIDDEKAWCGYTNAPRLIAFQLPERAGGGWIFQALDTHNAAHAEWHVVNKRAKVRAFAAGTVVQGTQLFSFEPIAE